MMCLSDILKCLGSKSRCAHLLQQFRDAEKTIRRVQNSDLHFISEAAAFVVVCRSKTKQADTMRDLLVQMLGLKKPNTNIRNPRPKARLSNTAQKQETKDEPGDGEKESSDGETAEQYHKRLETLQMMDEADSPNKLQVRLKVPSKSSVKFDECESSALVRSSVTNLHETINMIPRLVPSQLISSEIKSGLRRRREFEWLSCS